MTAPTNPFPGMNPWLEQRWGDVHTRLISYTADMLQERLPDALRARMQERVFIASGEEPHRAVYPDVHLYERRDRAPSPGGATPAGAAVAQPMVVHVSEGEMTQSYLEIIDARTGGQVVTRIEFISRANKAPGRGRELYLQKQKEATDAGANIVEIDLLREGEPVSQVPQYRIPERYRTSYHVSVRRVSKPQQFEYYRAPLRERLPTIANPLRPSDTELPLDLQSLINLAYQRGRYDDIDYAQPPDPPLQDDAAQWARQTLQATGGDSAPQ